MKKGQEQSSSHSCTELSKTQSFPVSIVNPSLPDPGRGENFIKPFQAPQRSVKIKI